MQTPLFLPYIFDLELTNICNTSCTFCPREEIKRASGRMTAETFERFLKRLKEYASRFEGEAAELLVEQAKFRIPPREQSPIRVLLCGMGENLTHPQCPEWIGRIRSEVGVRASVVSNGALLTEKMIERLIAAQITTIAVSVPGITAESYNRFVPLNFERTLANIIRANELLPGRIEINVTLAKNAGFTADEVIAFWGERGIPIASIIHCHNRGGHLRDEAILSNNLPPASKFCGIIARHNYIAWDGRVLSCCHDLHGTAVLGDVFEQDFVEIAARRTPHILQGPRFDICARCDDQQRAEAQGLIRLPRYRVELREVQQSATVQSAPDKM